MDYIALLHKDPHSDFGVSFPDFPGCVTAGRTLEEARQMAGEALELHIEGLVEDGQEIPRPSRLVDVRHRPSAAGAEPFMVSVEPSAEKTVRINITARKRQLVAIDRLARKTGLTRSAYMVQSSLGLVGSHRAKKGRRAAARPHPPPKGRKAGRKARV